MKAPKYTNYGLLLLALLPCQTQAGDDAAATGKLLDRIVQQEREFTVSMRTRSALLETYIQELPDSGSGDIVRDHYFLGRLEFSRNLNYVPMSAHAETPNSLRPAFLKNHTTAFVPTGFGQMAILDAEGFDRGQYNLTYVRREFLGEVRCLAFDVSPLNKKAQGKFIGRIWVEDVDYHIVRFNGTYTN